MKNNITIGDMKDYCEMAIKLERESAMWLTLMSEANNKMRVYDEEHQSLQNLITQIQDELAGLSAHCQKEVLEKKREIGKCKRNCRISISVIIILTIFILLAAIFIVLSTMRRQGIQAGQIPAAIVGLFLGGVTFLVGPYIICFIIFGVNRSKQNALLKETANNEVMRKTEKTKEVLQTRYNKAKSEFMEIKNHELILSNQQIELKKSLDAARDRLQQFYSIGFIHKAYQKFDAVVSFFYYLDTGRVTAIDGAGGLWDTYQKDCQHREQIHELKTIKRTIEEHESHEQMRHQELLGTLKSMENKITSSLGRIENNTAKTAENSEISAASNKQQEEYLKYMATETWRRV